ncbi:MAG: hypothetical protein ACKPB9_05390 [Dolichospermum sp.]
MVQLLDEAINKVKNLPESEQERIALLSKKFLKKPHLKILILKKKENN